MTTYISHKTNPQFRLTTNYGGSNYTFTNDQMTTGSVTRVENGFDTATFLLSDRMANAGSVNWLSKVDAGSTIKLEGKDASDTNWTTMLNGVVRFLNTLFDSNGEFIELKCDGAGYGLDQALVALDYGSESAHSAIDTFREVLNFAAAIYGIIPGYVNRIFGAGASGDSGFNYTASNTTIEDIAGTIKYLYFPYVSATRAITDLCDYVQAIKGANAGPHWIVTTDATPSFLACTLGADHPDAANNGWYKYYKNTSDITLEQGRDFKTENFTKMQREANYILYHGAFQKPADGDLWTENNHGLWGSTAGALSDDNATYKIGSYSLQWDPGNVAGDDCYYPSARNASWDMSKIGGQFNIPSISFWLYNDVANPQSFNVMLDSHVGGLAGYFELNSLIQPTFQRWVSYEIPIGDYAKRAGIEEIYWVPHTIAGAPTWSDIDDVRFWTASNAGQLYIDGLRFNGQVLRGAKDNAISSTNPYKAKLISDDIARDDSLVDDTGTVGRLTYAEYLRCNNTPIVGSVTVPWLYDLLPGQFIHIHAKKTASGSFNIDKDMRVTSLTHTISDRGFLTTLQLTDDLKNSNPRKNFLDYQNVIKAHSQYSDRQTSSFKTRSIDVTQSIMETSY